MTRALSLAAVLSLALFAAGCKDDHEALAKKAVGKLNDLASTLATVKDQASSKAAAPKVKSIIDDVVELKKKEEALPKLSADEKKKLDEAHKKDGEEIGKKLFGEMM